MDIDVWQESEFTFSQPTGIRLNWKRGDHTDFSDIIKIKFYVKGIVELTSNSNGVYSDESCKNQQQNQKRCQ